MQHKLHKRIKTDPVNILLSLDDMAEASPMCRGRLGRIFARILMDTLGMSRLNRLYDNSFSSRHVESASKLIDGMDCNYLIGNADRLSALPEGPFITISNHPYGGLDGLILAELIGGKRPDYKILVNKILARAKSLDDAFITVTPTTTEKKAPDAITIMGIKTVLNHMSAGHPIGCFPSGAVSDFKINTFTLEDREWQPSMIHLIKRARLPIVPIYFPDRNSRFYYFLGLINWKIRYLRLPLEFFNKYKGRHRVIIGETITAGEQDMHADSSAYGKWLRSRVYDMPRPEQYVARNQYLKPEG